MASGRRARRLRNITSTIRLSIETTTDSVPPLSNSNNLSNNRESNRIGYEPDKTEVLQRKRVLFTPEPKPYDPETYGALGR